MLTLVVGLGISTLLFLQARAVAVRDLREALDDQAGKRVELLRSQILRSMEVLHSIGAMFSAQPGVTAGDFKHFVDQALARQPELQALGWSPRITREQRGQFEASLPKAELSHTEIVELSGDGQVIPAADRPEYVPVLYIEPMSHNDAALGFDLASSQPRRDALALAASTHSPAATSPIELVQGQPGQLGFVVYQACFKLSNQPTGSRELTGYSSAVFRLNTLLRDATAESTSAGMNIKVVDDLTGNPLMQLNEEPSKGALSSLKFIDVAGRRWSISFVPRRSFIALRHTGREWVVLGTSLAITLLLTVYLYGGLRRTLEIERRVIERTRQLSAEVAERRRAEASARLAEAKYRGIFENSVEGIFQTSLDGKYISANRSLARIYGYESADQLITDLSNIAIQLYVQSGRRDEFSNLIRKCGTVAGFESQVFRKDGTVIWISESARTVSDERGHLLYYEGAVIDISERKSAESDREREHDELEERVRERTEALAAANAAKSRFLASMSHEIRTPMNAILGYAQLLRRDPTLRDTQRDAMSTIVSSGNHLLGLIDDILDLSRIEAGHLELQPSNFDLPTMVTDLANMFRQRCDQKGLSLQIDLPSECRELVRGDEQKLRQVLVNLLGNAIRFTDAGTVTLSVRRHTSIACGFEVFDTGIGIPNDSMAQIFEAFQQADGHGRGGSGLGLAIARQHVRLMGGELFVESTVGIGSRFHFVVSLPASDEAIEENRGTVGTITRLAEGHAVNAVIIDDVRENRLVLAEMLTSIGCQATSFSSGIAAIESFSHSRAERPDIIFLDTLMPELDGIATARALQKMSSLDGVRLVATSAAAGAHQQDRYAVAGFHDVLIKPIVCERLYAVLASQLGVQFEYGSVAIDPETQDTKARPSHRITTEVARLSISLRDRLRRTAELCGITELRQCAEELERSEPPAIYLARSVRACLQTYDTLPLLQVLATADTQSSDGLDPTPTGAGA